MYQFELFDICHGQSAIFLMLHQCDDWRLVLVTLESEPRVSLHYLVRLNFSALLKDIES